MTKLKPLTKKKVDRWHEIEERRKAKYDAARKRKKDKVYLGSAEDAHWGYSDDCDIVLDPDVVHFKGFKAFTMVEILVVIGILCILAGMVYPVMKMVWRKNADAKTVATIGQVQAAIDAYHAKNGYYPQMPDTNGDGVPDMPNTGDINGHRLRLSQVRSWGMDTGILQNDGTFVLDFYKRPLRYRSPGIVNVQTYDLWSTGADKKDGRGTGDLATSLTRGETDDLNNWSK